MTDTLQQGSIEPQAVDVASEAESTVASRSKEPKARKIERWHQMLNECREFARKNGRTPLQKSPDTYERMLGNWRNDQTNNLRRGALTAEQEQLLLSSNITVTLKDQVWHQTLERVQDFIRKHGRLPVSRDKPKTPDESSLAVWRHTQLEMHRYGKMSEERWALLKAAGLDESLADQIFRTKLLKVRTFATKCGHLPRWQQAKDENERVLGLWLYRQRHEVTAGITSAERVEKLREAGCLVRFLDDRWQTKLRAFKKFVDDNGRLPKGIGKQLPPDELAQFRWMQTQRAHKQAGTLAPERIEILAKLGAFAPIPKVDKFAEVMSRFYQFVKQHRRLPRQKAADPAEASLSHWCGRNIKRLRLGQLTETQANALRIALGLIDDQAKVAELTQVPSAPQPFFQKTEQPVPRNPFMG